MKGVALGRPRGRGVVRCSGGWEKKGGAAWGLVERHKAEAGASCCWSQGVTMEMGE